MKYKFCLLILILCSFFVKAQRYNAKGVRTWQYYNLKICKELVTQKFDLSKYMLSDDETYYYREKKYVAKEAGTKWVKKTADRNCLSSDPNDCLVWCLVQVPEEFTKSEITILAKDIVVEEGQKFQYNKPIETICTDNIPDKMFDDLAEKLTDLGYIRTQKITEKWTDYKAFYREELFDALIAFQQEHDFVEGFFDIKTLEFLGVVVR